VIHVPFAFLGAKSPARSLRLFSITMVVSMTLSFLVFDSRGAAAGIDDAAPMPRWQKTIDREGRRTADRWIMHAPCTMIRIRWIRHSPGGRMMVLTWWL